MQRNISACKELSVPIIVALTMQRIISAYGTGQVLTCKSLLSLPGYKYTRMSTRVLGHRYAPAHPL